MHSRKSIFYKGIVFVASMMAMMFFSFAKIEAACEVKFEKGDQYLTLGGDLSNWQEDPLMVTGGCSELVINEIKVNGKKIDEKIFSAKGRNPGHYTVGYNYSYKDGGSNVSGTIYRYLRILDSSFSTSNNYTLGEFNFSGATTIVDSFAIDNNYFVNFVVDETFSENSSTKASYVVVKDALGRDKTIVTEIQYNSKQIEVKKVIQQADKYYVIGNTSEGYGVVITYQVTVVSGSVTVSNYGSTYSYSDVAYNSGYVVDEKIYLAGRFLDKSENQTVGEFPIIDVIDSGTRTTVFKHTIQGEYNGIIFVNDTIYAVGYVKEQGAMYSKGIYTYISNEKSTIVTDILDEAASTKFNDITYDEVNGKNIIVGESTVNNIYANNALVAKNNNPAYHDAIILQVSLDGKSITGAHMHGANVDDRFLSIKKYSNESYVVIGDMNNQAGGLAYILNQSTFESEVAPISGNSGYQINGIVSWNYGFVYYGSLKQQSILGVYYPRTITNGQDALFLSLDNRAFSNYETVNLVKLNEDDEKVYKYCDYKLGFGTQEPYSYYGSTECQNDADAIIYAKETSTTKLSYIIPTNTGANIYVYRVVNIKNAPTPINLNSNTSTGILKWHVYNRSYKYLNDNSIRLDMDNFNYSFNVQYDKTISDMIDYYFEKGNTKPYVFSNKVANATKSFNRSNQTSAAFASIEYAKKYAYYQEFSRVIYVPNKDSQGKDVTVTSLGAYRYTGAGSTSIVEDGQSFYIYYIDYSGGNDKSLASMCSVSSTSITNCTAKGGYAFANLNDIKTVIEAFIQYNNYFVSTRQTIYNGSIEAAEIEQYKQQLTTSEYTTAIGFANKGTNLTFNIAQKDSENAIATTGKDVYFGGQVITDTSLKFDAKGQVGGTHTVTKATENGITYYYNDNYIFFPENRCYRVFYSSGTEKGSPRIFCLDNTAPEIVYKKEGFETYDSHKTTDLYGTSPERPVMVESDFKISTLIDLDEYAYIYVGGNRYPITCANESETCLADVEKYIKQSFKYDKDDPMAVRSISFADRLSNTNTFYFVIGTTAPSISIKNKEETKFTLVIDFYDTNPIISFGATVVQQACSGTSQNCYNPSDEDLTSITNSTEDFRKALENYIHAVSYADNASDQKVILEVEANEGVYTLTTIDGNSEVTISYIIQDGYLVEHDGYQESYGLDEQNVFTYKGVKYTYNELSSVIQEVIEVEVICDEEEKSQCKVLYKVDSSKDPINVSADNKFQFTEDGREYQIVNREEKVYVEAVSKKYEIKNNQFTIGEIIYTVDVDSEKITYRNPLVLGMKHIEVDFTRTTVNGEDLIGGVDIPVTKRVKNAQGVEQEDSYTGLPAYEVDTKEPAKHYNIVDGIYRFTIQQSFAPYTKSTQASINVKPLELKLGYRTNDGGMEVKTGVVLDFEGTADTSTSIAITKIGDSFKYPLDMSIVDSVSLGGYENTHFVNRALYASYQGGTIEITAFIIKVYTNKNSYGFPNPTNAKKCEEVIIYDKEYAGVEGPVDPVCDIHTELFLKVDNEEADADKLVSNNQSLLKQLGVTNIMNSAGDDNTGSFAFNGENKFYNISLVSYVGIETNNVTIYETSSETVSHSFYIDSIAPDYDDNTNEPTINPFVYNDEGVVTDAIFALDGNIHSLNKTVGGKSTVAFKVNWYAGEANDYRENKLLMMTILGGDEMHTCNVFQLLNNALYDTKCRDYIDVSKSVISDSEFIIAFTESGIYEISFQDASGNSAIYTFTIDKSSPTVSLVEASMDGSPISFDSRSIEKEELTVYEYTLGAFVKNPSFTVRLNDLSDLSGYCYYFDFAQGTPEKSCVYDGVSIENKFRMDVYKVGALTLDEYFVKNHTDMSVSLTIWAIDALGNGSEAYASKVYFWVDYKAPNAIFTYDNLNTDKIVGREIEDTYGNLDTTITILSGTYDGAIMACGDGFKFNDSRYTSLIPPYTFVVTCKDAHDLLLPGDYAESFRNQIFIKFYESNNGVDSTGEMFNFGIPTNEDDPRNARWIYITIEDSLGNASDDSMVVPIRVINPVAPRVEAAYKEIGEEDSGIFENLSAVQYKYPNGAEASVYLANRKIRIKISKPIKMVSSCRVVVSDGKSSTVNTECDNAQYGDGYIVGKTYTYAEQMMEFEFNSNFQGRYKLIVFQVEDFNETASGSIVVVIDKAAPTIDFKENGEIDEVLEYVSSPTIFGNAYMNGGHELHVNAKDDQDAPVRVSVSYSKYTPLVTYKNYVQTGVAADKTKIFETVADGTPRKSTTKYYILLKDDLVVNKSCVQKTKIADKDYCFVEDKQSYYYFDSFLTDLSDTIWSPVTQIDSNAIGIYRITYYVTDYAGNISTNVYKKVVVSDSVAPDIDMYNRAGNTKLFEKLTSTNPGGFAGQINSSIALKGTDIRDNNTRIVLYQCGLTAYENFELKKYGAESLCNIHQPLYTDDNKVYREESTNQWMRLGTNVASGVYKAFVYDYGSYSNIDSAGIYHNGTNINSEKVYSLTHNTSYFYFAVKVQHINANIEVNGNLASEKKQSTIKDEITTTYKFSENNYYVVKNGTNDTDLVLYRCAGGTNETTCDSVHAERAVGFTGTPEFNTISSNNVNTIVVTYKDSQGRMIYEVRYQEHYVAEGLLLHKTYHKVNADTKTSSVCKIVDGENECKNEGIVYLVTSVTAVIYPDGEYNMMFMDRYNNMSSFINFTVDNVPFTENKDDYGATGINYWFSVPSQVIDSTNIEYMSKVANILYAEDYDGGDFNIFDTPFVGNFNSEFFYAFASESDAKAFIYTLYKLKVEESRSSGSAYVFYDINGNTRTFTQNVSTIMEEIDNTIYKWVIPTYSGNKNFINESIHQVAYQYLTPVVNNDSQNVASSVYEYVFLKKTKNEDTYGNVSYSYALVDKAQCAGDNADCIKVNLEIVSADKITQFNPPEMDNRNTVVCIVSAYGKTNYSIDENCNSGIISGNIYIAIDSDVSENHVNTVFYGILVRDYDDNTKISTEINQVGDYVPLALFDAYTKNKDGEYKYLASLETYSYNSDSKEYVLDKKGLYIKVIESNTEKYVLKYTIYNDSYIWINSKFVNLNYLVSTSLYLEEEREFVGSSYYGFVYVSYMSRYKYDSKNERYNPKEDAGEGADYYYNYLDGQYYNKSQIMEKLGVDCTFGRNGERSEGSNGEYIPFKIRVSDHMELDPTKLPTKIVNNKVYIKLFDNISKHSIFEISEIMAQEGGYFREVYSYATMQITVNGSERYVNINKYIKLNADKTGYECIIDIDVNSFTTIKITDRVGNAISFNISHSDIIPEIEYKKVSEDATNSGVVITMSTSSGVSKIYTSDVNVSKDGTKVDVSTSSCVNYTEQSSTKLVLNFAGDVKCVGVYEIKVVDDHGNAIYKKFVFNPYLEDIYFDISESEKTHQYTEEDVNGVIVNEGFKVVVDFDLYDAVIYRYDAYTNLNLEESSELEPWVITKEDFPTSETLTTNLNSCVKLNIVGGKYVITVAGSNICDGIYELEVTNKMSKRVIDQGLTLLEGANSEVIKYKAIYQSSDFVTTRVEIDTIAPDMSKRESQRGDKTQNFRVCIEKDGDCLVATGEHEYDLTIELIDIRDKISSGSIDDENHIIKNDYVKIKWGGDYPSYSFAHMKFATSYDGYAYEISSEEFKSLTWTNVTDNVKYNPNFSASYKFMPDKEGVTYYYFVFEDAVGNVDYTKTITLAIQIVPPNVALLENTSNNPKIYKYNQRIAFEAMLKCDVALDGDNAVIGYRNCDPDEYEYTVIVNGETYSDMFTNDPWSFKMPINIDSYWLRDLIFAPNQKKELVVEIIVSVKGKQNIKTSLKIIIDMHAPTIEVDGTVIGSTYVGSPTVKIVKEDGDDSNNAYIFNCSYIDEKTGCHDQVLLGYIEKGQNSFTLESYYSGYFWIVAQDELGNQSSRWFVLDNQAPEMIVSKIQYTDSLDQSDIIYQNMYTNSKTVYIKVGDFISEYGSTCEVEFSPLDQKDTEVDIDCSQPAAVVLNKEGKYTITPVDGVGNKGRSLTFYIYRKSPLYLVADSKISTANDGLSKAFTNMLNKYHDNGEFTNQDRVSSEGVYLYWSNKTGDRAEYYAPIVSITVDGKLYDATYSDAIKGYKGGMIEEKGNHTIVAIDAAGNMSYTAVTINDTKGKICINGYALEVKGQGYYNINELYIGGEDNIEYAVNDVIIFALPSQVTSAQCMNDNLLGYRTLDPENSYYLIENERNAQVFNKTEKGIDFIHYGFISKEAIEEVKNTGGTVIVFVVSKDVANGQLGYNVGKNIFMEDPIGWTIILVTMLSMIWPTCRIFIKKKVRVI